MNLNSYLTKRKGSQFWQCRLMIPKASRAAMGRAEFIKSLKVADRREAERLAITLLADWRAQIDRAMRPNACT